MMDAGKLGSLPRKLASRLYRRSLARSPARIGALPATLPEALDLARRHELAGNETAAAAAFEIAHLLDPSCLPAAAHLTRARKARGDDAGAGRTVLAFVSSRVKTCSGALDRESARFVEEHASLLVEAGDAARGREDWQQAAACYEAYLRLVPERADVWVQLGHALKEVGRLSAAEACYRRAAALTPDDPDLAMQRGHIAKLLGRHETAVAHYGDALQARPDWSDPYRELAGLAAAERAYEIARGAMAPGHTRAPHTAGGARAIFTIVSNNYIAFARVLMESAERHYPECQRFLFVVDRLLPTPGEFPTGCHVVRCDEIGIPDFDVMAFRYGVVELNTALKPFAFRYLLETERLTSAIYLDPDIRIFRRSEQIMEALDAGAAVVLTPHLCQPAGARGEPDDAAIMRAGVFNLGFMAARAGAESQRLLEWWGRHLQFKCLQAPHEGLCVDQKFLDLAPCLFEGIHIHRRPGANVAYWNLAERGVSWSHGQPLAAGEPLEFFHFSGFDPRSPRRLSKYTELFSDNQDAALQRLLDDYARDLVAAGIERCRGQEYGFGRLASGARVPAALRHYFRERHLTWKGSPFHSYEDHILGERVSLRGTGLHVTGFAAYLLRDDPVMAQACAAHATDPDQLAAVYEARMRARSDLDAALAERLARTRWIERRRATPAPQRGRSRLPGRAATADVALIGDTGAEDIYGQTIRRIVAMLATAGLEVELVPLPGSSACDHVPPGARLARHAQAPVEIVVGSRAALMSYAALPRRSAHGRRIPRIAVPGGHELSPQTASDLSSARYAAVWPIDPDALIAGRETLAGCAPLPLWLASGGSPPNARALLGLPATAFIVLCPFDAADPATIELLQVALSAWSAAARNGEPASGQRVLIATCERLWTDLPLLRRLDAMLAATPSAQLATIGSSSEEAQRLLQAADAVLALPAGATSLYAADAAVAGKMVLSAAPRGLHKALADEVTALWQGPLRALAASVGAPAGAQDRRAVSDALAAILARLEPVRPAAEPSVSPPGAPPVSEPFTLGSSAGALAARLKGVRS